MTIAFTKTKLPFGWCSNMSGHPIVDENGIEWRTAEHLFQAMRFSDPSIREDIRGHGSPMAAKIYAKQLVEKMTVVPQSEEDVANMLKILRLKIAQHPNLVESLLSTGDEVIIEDVSKRPHGSGKFWGAALVAKEEPTDGWDCPHFDGIKAKDCPICQEKDMDSIFWEGENILGKLWMQIRSELRERMGHTH
jgi:predicted NAD-dependent protein-ADP-ribosyltransferase YbiA (DUF1768 family)